MKTTGVSSNGVTGSVDEIIDRLDENKSKLKSKADQYISKGMAGAEAAGDAFSDATERLSDKVDSLVKKSLKTLKDTSENAEAVVKKYPVTTAITVIGVSFLAGFLTAKCAKK